jgi:uncharacterized SAM-binding protein YcdF (DUF218 family)
MQIPSLLYLVSKIFWRIIQPGDLLILLLGLGFVLLFTRRNRLGIAVIALSELLVSSIAVLPIGHWLLVPLERRFPYVTDTPARVDGVIMLGGGGGPRPAPGRHHPGVEGRAQDFVVFADLARRYPGAKLVFAGGGPLSQDGAFREADAAREALNSMGIDTSRVTFERESRNTFENVVNARALVHPAPGEIWVLVTPAFHMPRSVGLFRGQGWAGRSFPIRWTPRSTPLLATMLSPFISRGISTRRRSHLRNGSACSPTAGSVTARVIFPPPDRGR